MKRRISIMLAALCISLMSFNAAASVPVLTNPDDVVQYGNGMTVVYNNNSSDGVTGEVTVTFDNAMKRGAWYNDGLIYFDYGQTCPSTSEPQYNYLYATCENSAKTLDCYVNISRDYYKESSKKTKTSYSSGRVWDSDDGKITGFVKDSSPLGWHASNNKANFGYNDL